MRFPVQLRNSVGADVGNYRACRSRRRIAASYAVKILQDSGAGRGDGVYLGRDLVITAAHVVNSVNPRVLIAGLKFVGGRPLR